MNNNIIKKINNKIISFIPLYKLYFILIIKDYKI